MTRSKLSSASSARPGSRCSRKTPGLLACCLLGLALISGQGCSSSSEHSYTKENIESSFRDVCKKEYGIDVIAKLTGETLWIYVPCEEVFEKADKPEKFSEDFVLQQKNNAFQDGMFKLEYIVKAAPGEGAERTSEYKYSKAFLQKINNVWKVLRRVAFSMDSSKKGEPKIFCLIAADTKYGFELREMFYYQDLKKVTYDFISWEEYQHRSIQETSIQPAAVGNATGSYLYYYDVSFQEFLAKQIEHRIKLKFQKPEVSKDADIDKEIINIVKYTLQTYQFKDFTYLEFRNLLTKKSIIVDYAMVWSARAN